MAYTFKLPLYTYLWMDPACVVSASYDSMMADMSHFVPSVSVRSVFPSSSFGRYFEPYNAATVTTEQHAIANYTISRSLLWQDNYIGITFYPYTNFNAGYIDSIILGLQYELSFMLSYILDWQTHTWPNQQPYLRTGMYINANTGSPQINIQTTTESIVLDKYIVGDFFYSASDGYYINTDTGSRKLITVRTQENLDRYATIENPYNTIVEVNTVVTDNFLQAVVGNAGSITGTLWQNANWSGGLYMPNSDTVSIYGSDQKFLIGSGGLITCGSVTASNITFNRSPVSWSINIAPTELSRIALEFRDTNVTIPSNVSITTASLLIVGESASMKINNNPVNNAFMYSGTVSFPPTTEGELRIWSASGVSGSHLGYIYVSSSWYAILTGSESYPTLSNGTY